MSWSAWDEQLEPLAQRANVALDGVQTRSGLPAVTGVTPLTLLMEKEENYPDDEDYEAGRSEGRVEGMQAALRFIFRDGYHPALASRRLYGLASKMCPELIAEMSMAEMASMFGETKQACDHRMKMMFSGTGVRSRDQKSVSAARKMSEAQMGNTSKAQGEMKKRILKGE